MQTVPKGGSLTCTDRQRVGVPDAALASGGSRGTKPQHITQWTLQPLGNPVPPPSPTGTSQGHRQSSLMLAEEAWRQAQIATAAPNDIFDVLALCGAFSYQDNHLK